MSLKHAIENFEIDDPQIDDKILEAALTSGDYPYGKKMKWRKYEEKLLDLQVELVKLQTHLKQSGERIVSIFEGRDAAGKGGAIKRYRENLNPRHTRVVALPAPSDREQMQWYFQRYVSHLPMAGETVLYDRSWYNRAVVEPVMGFCTPKQTQTFFNEVPSFERMLVDDGIHLFKFWLNISRPMQIKRFHDRRHNPLKAWKLSPVDLKALGKWDEYSEARNEMLTRTHTEYAPWHVVRANDKRRARLATITKVLSEMDYKGKDQKLINELDEEIIVAAPKFLAQSGDDE